MQPAEIRNLSDVDLGRRLDEAHQEMFNLRFQYATGQLKNTARMGEVRREIARLRTILRERELAVVRRGELSDGRSSDRRLVGEVVSNKMEKTVVVEVQRTRRHPLYGKVIRVNKRLQGARREQRLPGRAIEVRIVESRPYSKDTHWLVDEVLNRAAQIDTSSCRRRLGP